MGCVFGTILCIVIKRAVNLADMLNMPVEIHASAVFGLWTVMCLIFALTVLFPIRNMRKMKLSEQLKYE